jgi:hypothetical protein
MGNRFLYDETTRMETSARRGYSAMWWPGSRAAVAAAVAVAGSAIVSTISIQMADIPPN